MQHHLFGLIHFSLPYTTSSSLHSQLQQAEDNLKADHTGIEELKEEFTKRISTSEKKLQAVIKVCVYCYKAIMETMLFNFGMTTTPSVYVVCVYVVCVCVHVSVSL